MSGAFSGVRVLDLSTRLSGAWAARLFGDFGAEVITAGRADLPGFLGHYVNWNKRWSDRSVAALLGEADIVVTSSVRNELPNLPANIVHLSITPHGLDGPWAEVPGNDLTHCARTGWAMINRLADEPPLQLPVNQPGFIAGVAGFIGAAAALLRGAAECVDVSELEATALTCVPWAIMGIFIGGESLAHGPNRKRYRNQSGPLWRTGDGYINYGYGDWQRWQEALHFLGEDELAEDPDYISPWGRNQKDPVPVREALARASAARGKWELFHGLAAHRCISGVVQDARDLAASEQLRARDFLVTTPVGDTDCVTTGPIARLSATPWQLRSPAPEQPADAGFSGSGAAVSGSPGSQPLHGVRVLCFTQAWAGTFATEILALLGADVVQIETVQRPDVWRGAGSPVPPAVRDSTIAQSQLNTNGMYNTVNLNKRAITLDVTHPRGKAMFWQMVGNFDVLVDNFSPHVMTNWGVTLETLHEKRADMIFASVSGYGRQGPLAEYPANGATTEPMAGLASVHGYEGDQAMNTGGLIPDPISGYYLAASILAALYHRKRTGEGQRIDAAMIEAVSLQLGDALLEVAATGQVRKPAGNRHPVIAPHGVYGCAGDRWLALAAQDDASFAALCAHLGQPELAADARFADRSSRKHNEAALDAILDAWFGNREAEAEAGLLQAMGLHAAVCAEFMPTYRDGNAQFAERGFLRPVTHPESGTHLMPVMPWQMHNTPHSPVRASPRFGEHSQEVFAQELGLSPEQYEALVAEGVSGKERVGR
ncbi:MAG: CoA transferase [Pseudomonadota bacterium]